MNPYYNSIIDDINDDKILIDLSDSNLTDENIIKIADLIRENNSIKVLKIKRYSLYDRNALFKNIDKFTYHLNITETELYNQYKNNFKNKLTNKGFSYLFEALKYNNSIHTLILGDCTYIKYINHFIKDLSEMLLINTSITKLSFSMHADFTYKTFIKFCDAIKNHTFYSLHFNSLIFENDDFNDIFIEALKNQKHLQSLRIWNIKNNKISKIIENLNYIQKIRININDHNVLLYKSIFEALENKEYLTKLQIYSNYNIDIRLPLNFTSLIKLLNTNKNIKYLKINGQYKNFIGNDFIKSIIKSKLQTLKIISCYLKINDVIKIIRNNNTITNLTLSKNILSDRFYNLFDQLLLNKNITKINISYNSYDDFDLKDINSLINLIKNNNNIEKINLFECFNKYNKNNLKIFDALILNNSINTFKISSLCHYNINDKFINKICNIIKNNKTLNKLILDDKLIFYNEFSENFKFIPTLEIKLLTDEYYKKINDALKYNNSLIYIGMNNLFFKEHFIDNYKR